MAATSMKKLGLAFTKSARLFNHLCVGVKLTANGRQVEGLTSDFGVAG